MTPFPLIEVSGPPAERGRLYGAQAAERVRRSIAHYLSQLDSLGFTTEEVRRLARSFQPRIADFLPTHLEEMQGIAAGAGVEAELIVLLNARTEILHLARRERRTELADEPDGCTGAVLLPAATADGILVHGQNWDWKAECAETAVVLKVQRDDGPDFMTFTEAGGLARIGLNAAGIAVTANYLESDRDYAALGVPLALIRRRLLECEHMAEALKVAYCTPKSASNNILLSHAEGFAVDVECAPDESFLLYPSDGLLVHANHWQSPVALAKLRDAGIASTPDSIYRDWRVREALERDRGRLTRQHLREALFDRFGHPWAVCRPPRPSSHLTLSATVAMVIMQPAEGLMEVTPLPALNRAVTSYRLEPRSGAVA